MNPEIDYLNEKSISWRVKEAFEERADIWRRNSQLLMSYFDTENTITPRSKRIYDNI